VENIIKNTYILIVAHYPICQDKWRRHAKKWNVEQGEKKLEAFVVMTNDNGTVRIVQNMMFLFLTASYTMGTGSFPGVKRLGRGVDHPHLTSAKVKERVELYIYSLSGPSWPVLGWTLPFPRCRQIFAWHWNKITLY